MVFSPESIKIKPSLKCFSQSPKIVVNRPIQRQIFYEISHNFFSNLSWKVAEMDSGELMVINRSRRIDDNQLR